MVVDPACQRSRWAVDVSPARQRVLRGDSDSERGRDSAVRSARGSNKRREGVGRSVQHPVCVASWVRVGACLSQPRL